MALLDVGPQNRSLDNDYGATKGPNAAAAHDVLLYAGDPQAGGVEADAAGGYSPPTITNDGTTWPAAAGGAKTSAEVTFPTSTAEWTVGGSPAVFTHFVLRETATGDLWDSGRLDSPISVGAAGSSVKPTLTVFYNPTA